jgi:putative endonuclease
MAGLDPAIRWPTLAKIRAEKIKAWITGPSPVMTTIGRPCVDLGIHAVALARTNTDNKSMPGGWVYIVTNRPNGTLCVGVTSDLARRGWEHREGVAEGFSKKYGLKRLVWAERHDDIRMAIQREHNLKHWPRARKIQLILAGNPGWNDLYDQLA